MIEPAYPRVKVGSLTGLWTKNVPSRNLKLLSVFVVRVHDGHFAR